MSPEEREMLKRSVALAEENNDILRGIQSSMRLARFMSILYWVIIIGISLGAYYFVQPYIDQIVGVYGGAKSQLNDVSGTINSIRETLGK